MKIIFFKKIITKNDCVKSYELIKNALIDSLKSKIWPNKYSVIKKEGNHIKVNYKLFSVNFITYYSFKFLKNEIKYSPAKNHPLKGEVKISFTPLKKGCLIAWEGKYSNANILHWIFFKIYSILFFNAFSKKIKTLQ